MVITCGTLLTYQYAEATGLDEQLTRTMVFSCLLSANNPTGNNYSEIL
jgi:Ca2+-transporting ATPase